MIKIKKIKFFGFLAALVLVGSSISAMSAPVAAAIGNLSVEFENSPLFSENNFLPGSSVTRFVKVTNNTDLAQDVFTETNNELNSDNFGDVLDLVIKQGGAVVWNGSLTDFFATDKTPLSSINAQQTIQYDYTVSLVNGASNDFQGKTLGFDLVIGFLGTGDVVDDSSGTVTISGSSGGGWPVGLIIYNEAEINVGATTATITWLTNYSATSRVIYSAENEPHDFDYTNPPNYGYAHSTTDDLSKVVSHQVELTGLTPGTLYYYRAVSQASPDTVGLNQSFTTAGNKPEPLTDQIPPGKFQPESEALSSLPPGSSQPPGATGNESPNEVAQPVITETNQEQNGQVAGQEEVCRSRPWWLLATMIIGYLILMVINYLDRFNKELTNLKERLSFIFALLLAAWPVLVYFFTIGFAWWVWLIVLAAYGIVLIYYRYDLLSSNYWRLSLALTLYLFLMLLLLKIFIC
ncbi:MAG: hypothetical protein A3B89_00880 [Candidatus Buchananbacteria bacterium RIFCSPHIGHO2_02_FULL_40_13]|nr:MAG: hypothetical protein A2820_00945 [Candidatus Buchananbacteria bacterium RIFCSPHIGHO2_01_FULL_40_35]OGY50427.1 MAG: hypothetical protein A3B89_00880 [Candidatus Buchananbacteria bacterium RIFCSPHIGHO2_02_FULL_40_13]